MAAPTPNAPQPLKSGLIPTEWSAQAADKVIDTVALVRDKTTRPAQLAARGLVYGVILGVVGVAFAVLLLILVVRLWENFLPGDVWILYAILFFAMTAAGLVFLRKANRPVAAATTD